MNRSSFLSQHSDKNTGSFLNDSINTSKEHSEYKQQYQLLYKQMSQVRIQLRSTKQDNATLRSTLKGTQQQNATLKSLLATKKQLINKLNYQIRQSNQEINRLQDYNHILMNSNKEYMSRSAQLQQRVKETESLAREMQSRTREEKRALLQQMQEKERQMMKSRQLYEGRQRRQREQSSKSLQDTGRMVNQQVQQIINMFMKSTNVFVDNQMHEQSKLILKTQKTLIMPQVSHHTKQQTKSSNKSPSKHHYISLKQCNPPPKLLQAASTFCNLQSLSSKLLSFSSKIQERQSQAQRVIEKQQQQLVLCKQKMNTLEIQLQQSMQLFQQQINDIHGLKGKLKQKQISIGQAEKNKMAKLMEKSQYLRYINKKMIHILQNTVIHDNIDIFSKLDSMLQEPILTNKFELEVVLRQIETIGQANFRETIKVSLEHGNFQRLTRQYNEISQQYELMSLKYATLQRQYNQLLEDNSRLIRFNNLSQFRINRNTRSPFGKERWGQKRRGQGSKTAYDDLESKMMMSQLVEMNKQNLQSSCNK